MLNLPWPHLAPPLVSDSVPAQAADPEHPMVKVTALFLIRTVFAAGRVAPSGVEGGGLGGAVGAGLRVLKILAFDADDHVAIPPGVAKHPPTDLRPYLDAESRLDDPLGLRPLALSIRGAGSKIARGQPLLRLDGSVGVPHVALTHDSFGDAQPEPIGDPI